VPTFDSDTLRLRQKQEGGRKKGEGLDRDYLPNLISLGVNIKFESKEKVCFIWIEILEFFSMDYSPSSPGLQPPGTPSSASPTKKPVFQFDRIGSLVRKNAANKKKEQEFLTELDAEKERCSYSTLLYNSPLQLYSKNFKTTNTDTTRCLACE